MGKFATDFCYNLLLPRSKVILLCATIRLGGGEQLGYNYRHVQIGIHIVERFGNLLFCCVSFQGFSKVFLLFRLPVLNYLGLVAFTPAETLCGKVSGIGD